MFPYRSVVRFGLCWRLLDREVTEAPAQMAPEPVTHDPYGFGPALAFVASEREEQPQPPSPLSDQHTEVSQVLRRRYGL